MLLNKEAVLLNSPLDYSNQIKLFLLFLKQNLNTNIINQQQNELFTSEYNATKI